MDIQHRFPGVPWIWGGGISSVYEVHPREHCRQCSKAWRVRESNLDTQKNHVQDQQTMIVTKVEKLEPLPLRKEWLNDLAHAVAFLESLNLAHGDLRPENIQLGGDQPKLSDLHCTAEIGTDFEACMTLHGRILNGNEADQGQRGTSGVLGPRTEQFALGSLYYLINKKATMHQ
ncbi:uncharacterized protein CIMG_02069 [Coccidioides immitis RS]|uniref:Protein kinase domain-containing protein n=3 Tax=Coccidioides immitis TaxID=5501 RepID=J3KKK5_COCIM|nr:uncharacterized protein CIMG_02069 [Coccidioides immitis RS]EAS36715.3 hypothetical protein CIMG_02069 [Coccidioides immitis RS]KMP02080.1 hypothetical protein CIRG_02219 [Coccidioides immitis RMSCC 2394]KMU88256.1 hypothetical protein CIHG_05427 [Coccidioides immitis H538.4]TPX25181.1 hypothetical protein DIZ76_010630 [Coccidioides immitis]